MRVFGVLLALTALPLKAPVEAETPKGEASAVPADTSTSSGAVDTPEKEDSAPGMIALNELILVTGGSEMVETLPGSGHFIGKKQLDQQGQSDIHRILRQTEGVNVQEEDGFGLRPNIGMRGTGVNRSEKITLLEDGVLIAPAPYSAPAAYYFPTSERMEAVEVRKGSSTINQGPYTTGGVLNLVSTSIPASLRGSLKISAGSHDTLRAHGILGDSRERFGWLFEGYRLESGGFKDLDGGGRTGVELTDFVGKVRWNSSGTSGVHRSLELKLGKTDQFGEETYLGLSEGDFNRTPYRRYAASQQDYIDTEHDQAQVRFLAAPGARVVVVATIYRNSFFRNWHKIQSVDGWSLSTVLDDPDVYGEQMALLAGEVDGLSGNLAVRNNRRDYLSEGLESRVSVLFEGARIEHELEIGVRLHRDEEDRFQEEDLWNLVDSQMQLSSYGVPGSQANRISSAEAFAVYVSDTLQVGDLTLTPGVRVERIDFEKLDYGTSDQRRLGVDSRVSSNDAAVVLPGIGASYRLGPSWNVVGGVHIGFAAPGPGQDPETDAEQSLNHEVGFNYRSSTSELRPGARVVGFFNDYDNLIGRDSLASGGEGTNRTFNGGKVSVLGLEASLDVDLGARFEKAVAVPVRLGYTWTEAQFDSAFATSFADWSPMVRDGDRVPYIPKHQASLSAGFVGKRWDAFLAAALAGEMRTRPGRGPNPEGEGVDAHLIVDLAAHFELTKWLGASVQVRNLLDEEYLASRRPTGLRPGMPRTVLLGLSWGR
jgi:Fe(3+) dicitrate transport protein